MTKRNPTVGAYPDLFQREATPVVKELDEMSDEEIAALPRSAFTDDEWDELDENLQEQIRLNDNESQNRIQNMIDEFVKRHEWAEEPDTSYVQERMEEDFDYYFGEMGNDAVGYIKRYKRHAKDEVEGIIDEFREAGFAEDQIVAALNEALQDRDNWEFSYNTSEYGGAFFKAVSSDSFYIDKDELNEIVEGMYDDEIEEALGEINRKTYLSLELNDIQNAAEKWGIEISDYATYYADADPNWEKISAAVKATLDAVDPEGGGPVLDEDRVLYRFEDGGYVYDLLAEELPAEGRGRGLCVGSKQYGFIKAVEEGRNKIFSMRDADGNREYTMQAVMRPDGSLNYIGQIKREHNNLPQVEDVEKIVEFLEKGLGLPRKKWKDIQDLKPALREAGLIKSLPAPQENPEEEFHCGFCCPTNQP